MRLPLLAALALLAACTSRGPADLPEEQPSADEVACRSEARNSPERRRIGARRFGFNDEAVDRQMAAVEQRVYRECLLRRGIIESGGVEAPRRR